MAAGAADAKKRAAGASTEAAEGLGTKAPMPTLNAKAARAAAAKMTGSKAAEERAIGSGVGGSRAAAGRTFADA
eukprot:CAMPEP_0183419236 /NCGR_PEP_ID=MMETSP0370-20130417/25648_1 /TAXON_ID=268820 /ORGANISM="Peridinium aciculiferum, Strain PAER-2" /LENGTH=73 /DNA_ID=CAMNT_0025603023 /DNA_START=58 /DNA_END=279 /DNA_ORIENTATION=-